MSQIKRLAQEVGIFWAFMTGAKVAPPKPEKPKLPATWQDSLNQLQELYYEK